jgi:hypothetical protein
MTDMLPNSELVAVKWLSSLPGLTTSMVATTLPRDTSSWAANGFVQVGAVSGGAPEPYTGLRQPVISVHTWAVKPGTEKPPWGIAAQLFEYIIAACVINYGIQQVFTPRTGYSQALVHSAVIVSEPRRLPGDPTAYAHYQGDLLLNWASLA